MSERLPERETPKMNAHQELALRGLCDRYEVDFRHEHYFVYPEDSFMLPGYACGWVGGQRHANPEYAVPDEPLGKPTIYIGCSPLGEISS
jgi:hypothetical protein